MPQTLISRCSRPAILIGRRAAIQPLVVSQRILHRRIFSTIHLSQYTKRPPANELRPTANLPQKGGNDPKEVFSELNVLSGLPIPASAVESIYHDGFLLNNGQLVRGDGVFLLNNDVFRWKALLSSPVKGGTQMAELEAAAGKAKKTGLLELSDEVWGLLDVVYPKPDLLILGTGHRTLLLHPNSRKRIQDMGINLDVMDTHNAAAQYNVLATERPGSQVAAALLVAGFGR